MTRKTLFFRFSSYLLFLIVLDLLNPETHSPTMQWVRHPQHVVQVFVLLSSSADDVRERPTGRGEEIIV